MELYKKVKYVFERFIFHGRKFVKDVDTFLSPKVETAEEAKKLLRESAKPIDLIEISKAIHGVYYADGKMKTFMSSSEYSSYDVGSLDTKIYYFNGQKNDFINDEELINVYKVLKDIDNKPKDVFAVMNSGKYQYFFMVKEGKNGHGDFVDDDMKNIIKLLDTMKENGASWRCLTDVSIDIPDDLSYWVITFTVS